ncbi:MAG: metallophosphoesterase, partial [Nanoarchaeota archaeon]
ITSPIEMMGVWGYMKILVFGDVHGKMDILSNIIKNIKIKPDIVICPGDFTDMFETIEGFSQIDIADMILQKLLSFNCPVICVPGNHDPPDILKLFNQYGANLHGKLKEINGFLFMGWGGALTPFNTYFEPSSEETRTNLNRMSDKIKNKKFILVVHDPPKNTNVDRVMSGGHVGSSVIKEFIIKQKPILCISAHIHESGGTDRVGDTILFYPGPVYEGFYGVVNIDDKKITCEVKKVK